MKKELKLQEKQIAKASILNQKNLHKLLVILRDMYPAGYMYKNLKKRVGIEILPESQLKELIKVGLLELYDVPKLFKETFPEAGKKFPQYMIAKGGFDFLNNIEIRNLSRNMKWLTVILIIFGLITIALMVIQIFF